MKISKMYFLVLPLFLMLVAENIFGECPCQRRMANRAEKKVVVAEQPAKVEVVAHEKEVIAPKEEVRPEMAPAVQEPAK